MFNGGTGDHEGGAFACIGGCCAAAEGSYARLLTNQDSYQINVQASPTFVPGSATLFPGTDDLKSITWTNAGLSVLSFARDTVDRTTQRADNLDASVEKYFGRTAAITVTAFRKHVDGFITFVSNSEVHDGATYEVTRPQNGTGADIRGVELAYQQFYDFLPGKWAGLGLQANYTYVDSESPSSVLGIAAPLQNLSENSLNLIGMYERGGVSVRVAYNWRDKFLSGVTNIVGVGALPIYTRAYGWLDASLRYRFTDKLSLAIEGINLLGTMRRSYYGVTTRPQSVWLDDTQLAVTLMIRI